MFLWLISPKNVFHGEKMPMFKKVIFSMLIAFCYIFCYINLQEINARQKMVAFYITMLLENALLVAVWLGGLRSSPWYQYPVTALVFVSFGFGVVFMIFYYQHFHVKRLKHNYTVSSSINTYSSCTGTLTLYTHIYLFIYSSFCYLCREFCYKRKIYIVY